ncbi:DUF2268 domain-containing protein [Bacillus sp. CGMCC 1.16607]|uniref:DUF2268 domain-containing protein n=1 Tax=Bacillus sp. CGMCC 1.16607 TaxID=3351842 RepID=UPI00363412B2
MGIEKTNTWLKDSFNDPIAICKKISPSSSKKELNKLYQYLCQFGMYRPTKDCQTTYEELIKNKTWEKVQSYFQKYKKEWNGPDIPIYIFPIGNRNGLFFKSNNSKSGVSFQDKLFLFLSNVKDDKEIEALFVHEYHHVCRMNGLKKSISEYTLLDSLIMEGLAEDAVHEHLGKQYTASWSKELSDEHFQQYWKKYLKEHLAVKKSDSLHDHLLFGKGLVPNMLGYTCGYHLVRTYKKKKHFSTISSFLLSPEIFFKNASK